MISKHIVAFLIDWVEKIHLKQANGIISETLKSGCG
jgi:hypothetical protein